MLSILKRLVREEEGQGLVEYGLIIALVAILLIGALVFLRGGLEGIFDDIGDTLESPEDATDDRT